MDRLRNKVEPFAALFLALGIALAYTLPADPASLNRALYTKPVLIWTYCL